MSYTLKTSGIATALVTCVAVDSDGVIKEFVSIRDSTDVLANMTLGTGVAASVANTTWKGRAIKSWASTNIDAYNFNGVHFASGHRNQHSWQDSNGISFFEAYISIGAPQNQWACIAHTKPGNTGDGLSNPGFAGLYFSGNYYVYTNAVITANDNFKFAAAATFKHSGGGSKAFYGVESGSTFPNDLFTGQNSSWGAGFGPGGGETVAIGGFPGYGNLPARRTISCVFNRVLTDSEMLSLFLDPHGVLFDGLAGGGTNPTFDGPSIGNITGVVGVALTPVDYHTKWTILETPGTFSKSASATTWPAWANVSTGGVVSGTPSAAATTSGVAIKCTDNLSQTVDSNTFDIIISAAPAPPPPSVKRISLIP